MVHNLLLIHALILQTCDSSPFSFEIWASNPPSTFHLRFVNFNLAVFSTNSIVSLTILGLPSRFCALMFLHPIFLCSSFLAFSCLRQSSRKCCTVSVLCPHLHCGSSIMLDRYRYSLSPQCPVHSCVSVAPCFRFRELCSFVPVCTILVWGVWLCLVVDFSVFQDSIVFFVISAFITIICDDFSLHTSTGDSPCSFSFAARFASSSALSLPSMSMCPGTHSIWNMRCGFFSCIFFQVIVYTAQYILS